VASHTHTLPLPSFDDSPITCGSSQRVNVHVAVTSAWLISTHTHATSFAPRVFIGSNTWTALLLLQPPAASAESRDRGCRPPPVIPAGARPRLRLGCPAAPAAALRAVRIAVESKVLPPGWLHDRVTPHGSPLA
jgi:hypothetical protein